MLATPTRRRRMLQLKRSRVVLAFVVGILICFSFSWVFWYCSVYYRELLFGMSCSNRDAKQFIRQLCYSYSKGHVTGSLCRSLCVDKEIQFYTCLGHETGAHVIQALWQERWRGQLVLKVETNLESIKQRYFSSYSMDQLNSYWTTRERVTERLELSLQDVFGQLSDEMVVVVSGIVESCDAGRDGILLFQEEVCCWYFVNKHEYVILAVLQDLTGIPALIGTCGNLYAMEYASTNPLVTPTLFGESRSWDFRVALAVALIQMVESFENTKYGAVYLCDMIPGNFGLVKTWDEKYVVRGVDHDRTYPEGYLRSLLRSNMNNVCTKDSDCWIQDCQVRCNNEIGTCSEELMSNNLQILCQRLLTTKMVYKPSVQKMPSYSGLLTDPPMESAKEINALLSECVNPLTPSPHSSLLLANKLIDVLQESIK